MANTFSIPVFAISNKACAPGAWYRFNVAGNSYSSTDANIIASVKLNNSAIFDVRLSEEAPPPNPLHTSTGGTGVLTFDMDTAHITLTGAVSGTFDISGLPAGFAITAATLAVHLSSALGSADVTKDGFVLHTEVYNGVPGTVVIPGPFTIAGIFEAVYGFNIATVAGWMPPLTAFVYGLSLSGTYEIQYFSYVLQDSSPISQGSLVKAASTGSSPLTPIDFTQVLTLTMSFSGGTINIPSNLWTLINSTSFWFLIPSFGAFTPPVVEFLITGTQFSGTQSLGKMATIYFVDAPGVYRLVDGQLFDILYDVVNGGTVDYKIPDPYARTAFVP